jgi:hypothetical protein
MAFADYLDLRIAVAEAVEDDGLSDVMPRLVLLAETMFNRILRTRHQMTATTLTLASGEAALPADYLQMLHVYNNSGGKMKQSSLAEVKTSQSSYSRYAVDQSKIYINGFDGDRDIVYFAKVPTLTASLTTSNWLLENYPDAYLYAVAIEAAKYRKNVPLAQNYGALLADSIAQINQENSAALWSDSVIRIAGATP